MIKDNFIKANSNNNESLKESSNKKNNNFTSKILNFKFFTKKFFLILIAILFGVFFLFLVFFATVIAVIHFIDPVKSNAIISDLGVHNPQVNSFVDDVLQAIESMIYIIFIRPILWLLGKFQSVIFFLGGGSLSNLILFNSTDGSTWGVPNEYLITLLIAIGLIFILLGLKMILIMTESQNRKGYLFRTTIKSFFLVILGLVLLPVIFFFFNTLIILVTNIIIQGTGSINKNIGLVIFNNSFNNGVHHFTYVPDSFNFNDSNHFNYIICLFSEGFMVYIFLLIVMNLFTRIFELLLFYCVGPFVIVSTIADTTGSYSHLKNWSNLVTQRFLLFTFIFLSYNIFLNAVSLFSRASLALPDETTRPIFILLGVFGAGIVCVKAPTLMSAIIGSKTSLIDSIGHLSALMTTTGGLAAGSALVSSVLFGSQQSRNVRSEKNMSSNFLLNAGGATGLARGAVGSSISTVGAVTNPSKSLNYVANSISNVRNNVKGYYASKFTKIQK